MGSELSPAIQQPEGDRSAQDILNAALARKEIVLAELNILDATIKYYQKSTKAESKSVAQLVKIKPKPRVRGVFAAARKAIDQLQGQFDKNQLIEKLVEIDGEFAHKKITGANIRNALRLLTQSGVIKVASEATATSCAKYVKAA
ncbi:MAG TPA: hypothetical protein VFI24_15295 [Pyrinomonadaceae bacterium]|nr:hypothetical protein [Pyrinomonadaceae bacterium]